MNASDIAGQWSLNVFRPVSIACDTISILG